MTIAVLCGGVGGSRFVRALSETIDPPKITAIVNTADDDVFHGLYVSPDPDIVTYALAGEVDEERGWGLRGDTFRWLEHVGRLGHETWFQIGDRDLASHLHRTKLLADGKTLTDTMASIADSFRVRVRLLPMSDDRVRTVVETDAGALSFQRYLVERHARDAVRTVRFAGADGAKPAPGVMAAINEAETIFIAPSNPIASIGPILAVPGIRAAIEASGAPCVAVSPIIGGRSLQPPAGEMMAGLGHEVSAAGVALYYRGLIDALVIDEADEAAVPAIEAAGVKAIVARTVMKNKSSRRELAAAALKAAGMLRA